jgi:gluconate 2-dehydrogenase gamma chain
LTILVDSWKISDLWKNFPKLFITGRRLECIPRCIRRRMTTDRGGTMNDDRITRRGLLKAGAALGAATAATVPLAPAEARTIKGEMPWAPGEADAPQPPAPGGYTFFTPEEAAFVEAACARLIPADEQGPGARELGCPFFIDRQLGGAYGRAQRWYMQGPWAKGEKTQGYQSRLAPADVYRAAIKGVDDWCRAHLGNKSFAELGPADQDKVLAQMEDGKVALDGVDVGTFFKLLLHNTVEGFFADPLYGGNKDMAAWKMIGFPGARYDYRDWVKQHGKPYPRPPVGLRGRPAWLAQNG